jgi:Protein of unknown function (DUF1682)
MTRLKFFIGLLILSTSMVMNCRADNFEDNEFAEFEDFDADEFVQEPKTVETGGGKPQAKIPDDAKKEKDEFVALEDDIIIEDEEFEHFQDEEEFEGFTGDSGDQGDLNDRKKGEPKLTVAKNVPMHFRTHWDSYLLEILMLIGLLTYFVNYFVGKNKNTRLANMWLQTHKSLLEDNFALIGEFKRKSQLTLSIN